jgi:hypothetical protein
MLSAQGNDGDVATGKVGNKIKPVIWKEANLSH